MRIPVMSFALAVLTLCGAPRQCRGRRRYPSRPIRVIVPVGAGAGIDNAARITAEAVEKHLGQRLVIENKPGASMRIGSSLVAKSPPDGYTLLFTAPAPIVATEHFPPKLDFDPARDIRPVVIAVYQPVLLIVQTDFGGEDSGGVHRLRQAQPRKDIVRRAGAHRRDAADAGNPQAGGRRRHHAYSLQFRRAGDRRPAGRPARRHVPGDPADQGTRRERQAAGARDVERQAPAGVSRTSPP